VDHDEVELSNLQRQIIHREQSLGQAKVMSAEQTLHELNSDTQVTALHRQLDEDLLAELLVDVDLVVDACDNFSTRFLINRLCVRHRRPLVSGAAIRLEGQVAVFDSRREDSPCYQCLYRGGDDEQMSCAR